MRRDAEMKTTKETEGTQDPRTSFILFLPQLVVTILSHPLPTELVSLHLAFTSNR